MKQIVIPVTVGKKEILIKSVDSVFELHDNRIELFMKYKYSEPKDKDDEYSAMEDRLCEFNQVILKSHISGIHLMWDRIDKCYIIDISADGKGIAWNMASKESAIKMYDEIKAWWLG